MLVATISTIVSVGLAALSAYALSRLRFAGAGLLTTLLLITYLLPGTLLFIPLYQTLNALGLINSYGALIITYPTFLLPFATWVLMGYFRSIPVELEEAAMIDGASRLYIFARITLPLAAPAILSVALFAFTNAWNEFLFAVVLGGNKVRPVTVAMFNFISVEQTQWARLAAGAMVALALVILVGLLAQRHIVKGLTVGAVKGGGRR